MINKIHHRYPNIAVLLYGGPDEIQFNDALIQAAPHNVIDMGCENSLADFISLLSLSDIIFTPDSLGMQISVALGITTIVVVGPTSPWELDVFNKGEIVFPQLDCVGCYLSKCEKSPYCMELVTPDMILKIIEKYL